ncbi:MAG: P-type conjugative transfer protein TrbL [Succinivibrio sp.]
MRNNIFKLNSRLWLYLVLAVICFAAINFNCAFADYEAGDAPSHGLSTFTEAMLSKLEQFSESFKEGAKNLFLGLAVIAIVWSFGQLVIKGTEISTFFFEVLRVTLTIGFFWWLISDFPNVLGNLFKKFGDWGINVTHLSATGPAELINSVTMLVVKLLNPTGSAFNLTLFFVSFVGCLFAIYIMVFAIFMALNLIIYEIEFLFFTYIGVFVLGTAGSSWTRDTSIAYIKKIIAYSVQYFATLVLLGLCLDIVNKYTNSVAMYQENWKFGNMILAQLNILGVFLVTGKVVQIIPQALAGLFGGGSSAGYDAGGVAGRVAGGAATAAAAPILGATGVGAATFARNLGGLGKSFAGSLLNKGMSSNNATVAKVAGAMSAAGKMAKKTADFTGFSAGAKSMVQRAFGKDSQNSQK